MQLGIRGFPNPEMVQKTTSDVCLCSWRDSKYPLVGQVVSKTLQSGIESRGLRI